ncbi:deleted in malignant brain tumors 1 protein-like isoform X4 [Pomacea canaliculata]|uniref:deleted in malignant brain tumors 1 protein-like isoform X4 n=1 Tax=Pomacea canaliculata TaxID=400727 RepID=UPI000D73D09A|nr:deleted in malignant brain tumors 1 protein-like isoform X4 [Pomacea canaliculata]
MYSECRYDYVQVHDACSYSIPLRGGPRQYYFRYPENNENYYNNLDCGWHFKTDSSNYVVHVNFTFVDTEYIANCSYDYIDIFDGTPLQATGLRRLCGQLGQQWEFYSTGQSMYIRFHSDPAVTGQGFRLTYTSALRSEVPQDSYGVCVQVYVQAATYSNQNLRYPYLPVNYVNNADCYWLLQTSLLDYVVAVTFTFVDIEYSNGCPYDYVQLFDGSSTSADSLGKVCRLTSETFYSSGPSMYIRFHSDGSTTKRGFQLTYRAVSRLNVPATTPFVEELSLTAWSSTEYLQYPTASASYPNNADRGWLIKTSDYDIGYTVHVTFTFVDTEYSSNCANDYIEVFDGSSVSSSSLGKLCGSTTRDFYGTWSSMYIRFHSNGAVTGRGFNLTYQAVKKAVNKAVNEDTSPRIVSAGIIAGPVVGGVVGIVCVVYALTSCIRCRRKQSTRNDTTNTHINTNIHMNAAFSYPANDPVTAIPPSVNLNLVSLTVNLPPETASPPPETARPPPDIARPPSYTAEPPPPYDGNVQGASYPDAVNKPLPQKSQYPTTKQTPSAPPASQRRK